MPYLYRTRSSNRRRGLRGLADVITQQWGQGTGSWNITFVDQNGATLSWSALSAAEKGQAINAAAASSFFGEPAGSSLVVKVDGSGAPGDQAAFTLTAPTGGYSLPMRPAGSFSLIPQEVLRASNVLDGTGPVPTNAGGVTAASLPANFQVAQAASSDSSSSTSGIPLWVWLAGGGLAAFIWFGGKA